MINGESILESQLKMLLVSQKIIKSHVLTSLENGNIWFDDDVCNKIEQSNMPWLFGIGGEYGDDTGDVI